MSQISGKSLETFWGTIDVVNKVTVTVTVSSLWFSSGVDWTDSQKCLQLFLSSSHILGSVLDQALESLLHRLRGLCDNMEPETFTDHELVYLLKGQQGNPFILRARRSLSHPTSPWHLRYLGQPEVGDKSRHALVRNCVDVAASHSLPEFLNEMGFRMDHEFVANGHIFRKGAMKVVVSKLSRILVPGNTENTERLSLSCLVELSLLAPAGQDTASEEMRSFAEQLKPLVHLEKIDPSKQRHWRADCAFNWDHFFVLHFL